MIKLPLFDKIKMSKAFCLLALGLLCPVSYSAPFIANKNYLAMNLNHSDYKDLITVVESAQALKLHSRGESHITVITPPEFEVLSKNVTIQEINKVAVDSSMQNSVFEKKCIGEGKKDDLRTYFVVVSAPSLLTSRKSISALYIKKGGQVKDFIAEDFLPHITIGFTQRDLFELDGVVKNVASCILPLP